MSGRMTARTPASGAPSPKPARNGDADGVLGADAAFAMLDRLPLAVAAFANPAPHRLLHANDLFRNWFGDVESEAHWRSQFEGATTSAERDAGTDGGPIVDLHHPTRDTWYRLHWETIADDDGGVMRCVSVIDVNSQMQALHQHKARQDSLLFNARRMSVGEMATTLAHELNQPLAAIINYLSFARNLVPGISEPPARLDEAIELARSQAQHAADVVARMREFVRSREPRREHHDLATVIDSVLRLLQLEAQAHRVRIDVDAEPGLGTVHIDRVMVEQVLLNLVKNAIEALANVDVEQRHIRVSARANLENDAEVRVADRGVSLTPIQADQAFTPFYSTKSEGMGVGLSICRSIIEYHEGRLFFEPDPEGGNVFVFTLPRPSE